MHSSKYVRVASIEPVRKDELGRHVIRLRGRDERLPVSSAFLHRFRGMPGQANKPLSVAKSSPGSNSGVGSPPSQMAAACCAAV